MSLSSVTVAEYICLDNKYYNIHYNHGMFILNICQKLYPIPPSPCEEQNTEENTITSIKHVKPAGEGMCVAARWESSTSLPIHTCTTCTAVLQYICRYISQHSSTHQWCMHPSIVHVQVDFLLGSLILGYIRLLWKPTSILGVNK